MPRGSRKHASSHHRHHENSLVAPGRRIDKHKPGPVQATAAPAAAESPAPQIQHGVAEDTVAARNNPPQPASTSEPSSPGDLTPEDDGDPKLTHRNGDILAGYGPNNSGSTSPPASSTPSDSKPNTPVTPLDAYHARLLHSDSTNSRASDPSLLSLRRDTPAPLATTVRPASKSNAGLLPLALTVLRACPLRDTLAILIFLLSLPPTLVSLTNAVFAVITFVPPSGSFTSLPSLADITSSCSPGAPSLLVMLVIDLLAWLVFGFCTTTLQDLLLDFAQAMVATTLGGRPSSRPGAADNTLRCIGIVTLLHLSRHRSAIAYHLQRLGLLQWLPEGLPLPTWASTDDYQQGLTLHGQPTLHTLRALIALHIVCQGLTRIIRRCLYSSQRGNPTPGPNPDTEAAGSSAPTPESSELSATAPGTPNALRSISSLQTLRDGKDKISSGKRRRKQSNFVRSQQPLWAAFAATKATIMREYEQSLANTEAIGSGASEQQQLGDAQFFLQENRIWITDVQALNFFFETGPIAATSDLASLDRHHEDAVINRNKPVLVRINGADWTSVKMAPLPEVEAGTTSRRWTGDAYGLSPCNTYHVAFYLSRDGTLLYEDVLSTPASSIMERVLSPIASPASIIQPSRPTSPAATLRASIAAFESNIGDLAAQQRRVKKDSKAALIALRREVDGLADKDTRLATADRGLQTRHIQQQQHIKQVEDAIVSITEEMDRAESHAAQENLSWAKRKTSWEHLQQEHAELRQQIRQTKDQFQQEDNTAQADALSARQKRERLQQRSAKLASQHQRLISDSTPPSGKSRTSSASRNQRQAERQRLEAQYEEQNALLEQHFNDIGLQLQFLVQQSEQMQGFNEEALLSSSTSHGHEIPQEARPLTPEGDLPGTNAAAASNPAMSASHARGLSSFGSTSDAPFVHFADPSTVRANGHRNSATADAALVSGMLYDKSSGATPWDLAPIGGIVPSQSHDRARSTSTRSNRPSVWEWATNDSQAVKNADDQAQDIDDEDEDAEFFPASTSHHHHDWTSNGNGHGLNHNDSKPRGNGYGRPSKGHVSSGSSASTSVIAPPRPSSNHGAKTGNAFGVAQGNGSAKGSRSEASQVGVAKAGNGAGVGSKAGSGKGRGQNGASGRARGSRSSPLSA